MHCNGEDGSDGEGSGESNGGGDGDDDGDDSNYHEYDVRLLLVWRCQNLIKMYSEIMYVRIELLFWK